MTGVVLFQHGLGGGETQVAQNWPDTRNFTRLTLPCRGHDATPLGPDRPFTIPMFAQDILESADRVDRFCAGGISMGAAIALYLACHVPARVTALILIRPAWTFSAAPANMAPVAEMAGLLRQMPSSTARTTFAAGETGARLARDCPDNLASLLAYADRPNAAAFADVLRDIATGHPGVTEAQVAAVRLPCLIIGSEGDVLHPMASAEVLSRTIPDARLQRVTPKSEGRDRHQAEVRAAIADFLAEHFRSPS